MAKKNDSFEDYMKKVADVNLGPMSRRNLPQPDHEETLAELLAEGQRLLDEEEKLKKPKDESKQLESKLGSTSLNPYVRARHEILTKMADTQKKIIEKMEKGELEKDSRYDTFCKQVAVRGDQISQNN